LLNDIVRSEGTCKYEIHFYVIQAFSFSLLSLKLFLQHIWNIVFFFHKSVYLVPFLFDLSHYFVIHSAHVSQPMFF